MSLLSLHCLLIFILQFHFLLGDVARFCPNRCSNHGYCSLNSTAGDCQCFPGYVGVDCSIRTCPSGIAWVDYPSADNRAHARWTECSNMGVCNRQSGECKCRPGFSGAACDISLCPVTLTPEANITYGSTKRLCSGNGRCMTLRQISTYRDYVNYYDNTEEYTGWDADKVYGCVCQPGWEGAACDRRSCAKGDDPLTSNQYDEVQLIDCQCTTCEGGVYLTFQGQKSGLIPFTASPALVAQWIQKFTALKKAKFEVEMITGQQLCSSSGSVTQITFTWPTGPISSLGIEKANGLVGTKIAVRSKGETSKVESFTFSQTGTKEYVECSNHGICDYSTGTCKCFGGYEASDGRGNAGTKNDCGYMSSFTTSFVSNITEIVTACPHSNGALCSGNGICDEGLGTCQCYDGYKGPDCSRKSCSLARSWFGIVGENHTNYQECAGVGYCNDYTGQCEKCGGSWGIFGGTNCEYLACGRQNVSESNTTCNNNGACLTLREIASFTYNSQKELSNIVYDEPWDADIVRGCVCSRAISVDNQYDPNYPKIVYSSTFNRTSLLNFTVTGFNDSDIIKFYRGPYALAATGFKGYDCGQALCPTGDNPFTRGVNEIQSLVCRANNGSFTLTFRENTTLPISTNATINELKTRLEQIYTIGKVQITFSQPPIQVNQSVCTIDGDLMVFIEFLTEFGKVPLLQADVSGIWSYGYGLPSIHRDQIVIINRVQQCTKEDLECSGLGICNEANGQCKCIPGYYSSNGSVYSPGERGDCSYFNRFYTTIPTDGSS